MGEEGISKFDDAKWIVFCWFCNMNSLMKKTFCFRVKSRARGPFVGGSFWWNSREFLVLLENNIKPSSWRMCHGVLHREHPGSGFLGFSFTLAAKIFAKLIAPIMENFGLREIMEFFFPSAGLTGDLSHMIAALLEQRKPGNLLALSEGGQSGGAIAGGGMLCEIHLVAIPVCYRFQFHPAASVCDMLIWFVFYRDIRAASCYAKGPTIIIPQMSCRICPT